MCNIVDFVVIQRYLLIQVCVYDDGHLCCLCGVGALSELHQSCCCTWKSITGLRDSCQKTEVSLPKGSKFSQSELSPFQLCCFSTFVQREDISKVTEHLPRKVQMCPEDPDSSTTVQLPGTCTT